MSKHPLNLFAFILESFNLPFVYSSRTLKVDEPDVAIVVAEDMARLNVAVKYALGVEVLVCLKNIGPAAVSLYTISVAYFTSSLSPT